MSKTLPSIKAKEFIRALEKLGFVFRRQTGSHAIYRTGISTEELLEALR